MFLSEKTNTQHHFLIIKQQNISGDEGQEVIKVLLQLGLDGRTINSSAYPSFISGGRNSTGH